MATLVPRSRSVIKRVTIFFSASPLSQILHISIISCFMAVRKVWRVSRGCCRQPQKILSLTAILNASSQFHPQKKIPGRFIWPIEREFALLTFYKKTITCHFSYEKWFFAKKQFDHNDRNTFEQCYSNRLFCTEINIVVLRYFANWWESPFWVLIRAV